MHSLEPGLRQPPLDLSDGGRTRDAPGVQRHVRLDGLRQGLERHDVRDGHAPAEETMQIESAEVMADEEGAMDEEESNSALNEVQPPAAAPQATETIEEAAVEEAEAAPAAAEFDETQDSSPDSDGSNGDDAAASGATELRDTTPFGFLGQFPTQKSLQLELGDLPIERLDQRVEPVDPLEPGLFASCQQAVPELADVKVPTLIGQALVVDQAVEVHLVIADDGTVTILIVDTKNCSVLPTAS